MQFAEIRIVNHYPKKEKTHFDWSFCDMIFKAAIHCMILHIYHVLPKII